LLEVFTVGAEVVGRTNTVVSIVLGIGHTVTAVSARVLEALVGGWCLSDGFKH